MPEGRRFVIGDIHGCFKTLKYLLEKILKLNRSDILYFLGDTIDRGNGSKEVLDYIRKLSDSMTVKPVMGNHEYMMVQSYFDEKFFYKWTLNGCAQTLISFGVDPKNVNDPKVVSQIPKYYLEYVSQWPKFERTNDFIMVHAGIDGFIKDPYSDIDTLLWTRSENIPQDFEGLRKIIHGHTPIPLIQIQERVKNKTSKVLNLDGGCVYKGYAELGFLVALDLDKMEIYSIRNIE